MHMGRHVTSTRHVTNIIQVLNAEYSLHAIHLQLELEHID